MAAHDEFANKQSNPTFAGLGFAGDLSPLLFDMAPHQPGLPPRAPRDSPAPLPRGVIAAVRIVH